MEKTLTTKEETSVTNAQLIKEAQALTGEGGGTFTPFIPIIRVNNKKEEKEVIIDGKKKIMKVLPDASFNITRRDENSGNYETEVFCEAPLEAVVLRIRYKINEKFDKVNPKKKLFYSYDFDLTDQNIKVFDGNKEIACNNYKGLKKEFSTGENKAGFPTKSFDLMMVMYVHIDEDVFRFERKVTKDDAWYNYRNTFDRTDTVVAYKTKFLLEKAIAGDNEYWQLGFEKSDSVDLLEEVRLQKEISQYFRVAEVVRETPKDALPVVHVEEELNPASAPEVEEEIVVNDEEIAIPF